MTQKISVSQLAAPVNSGDWHDRPLKWAVSGPSNEVQIFSRKADAVSYAKIRRNAVDSNAAYRAFVRAG